MSVLEIGADTRFGRSAVYLTVIAAVVVVATRAGAFGESLLPLLGALALVGLALVLGVVESIAAPTVGKALWLAGLAWLVAPVFIEQIPMVAIFVGLMLLGLARFQRIREVFF